MSKQQQVDEAPSSEHLSTNLPSLHIERSHLIDRVNRLVLEMEEHIRTDTPVNLSVPPHVETTIALHRLVFAPGDKGDLRIEYSDGSRGMKFPVHALWQPKNGWAWQPKDNLHLRVGTLSLRHVSYDQYADLYLLRDKETRQLRQGDVDRLAYDEMQRLLKTPQLNGEFYITILQTGLEPLEVGLYRAVVEHLVERNTKGLGPMRIASIFGHNKDGGLPLPKTVWGAGVINP